MLRFIEVALLLVALGRVDGSSTTMTQSPDLTPVDVSTLSTPVTDEQENDEGVSYLLANIDGVGSVARESGGLFLVDYPQLGYNVTGTVGAYSRNYTYIGTSVMVTVGVESKAVVIHVFGEDISIYGYNTHSAFYPLPISALGSRYVVSTCLGYTDHVVLVIANYNQKTDVDITMMLEGNVTNDNVTYNDGDTIHVSLDGYQTFTLKSAYDLTGTVINTTRVVAVFSGAMARGIVRSVAQLLPVQHHGTEFVLSTRDYPYYWNAPYQLQLVSDQTDTEIMVNNGSTFSLDDNRVYRQNLVYNDTLYFNTSRSALATLCRKDTGNLAHGFVVITSVKYFLNTSHVIYGHCINILTKQHVTDIEVFRSDMTPATVDWVDISGSDYKTGTTCLYDSCFVRSSNEFALYAFYYDITNGGYHFPADQSTTRSATAGSSTTMTQSSDLTPADASTLSTPVTDEQENDEAGLSTTPATGKLYDTLNALKQKISVRCFQYGDVTNLTLICILYILTDISNTLSCKQSLHESSLQTKHIFLMCSLKFRS
ncbi:uncharacterized protein [Haliotis asinina]|uniref:uncharacterized protein n=1 Tax=Haliotis asinina TaxID=109174 RepID=UPI0035318DE1